MSHYTNCIKKKINVRKNFADNERIKKKEKKKRVINEEKKR